MRMGLGAAWIMAVLAFASVACAQLPAACGTRSEILREIDDAHTGDRWLLMRNDSVPGGPGRLVLASTQRHTANQTKLIKQTQEAPLPPVIRAGDRLIVEEHTAIADAVLRARALNPANVGSALKVRLAIGGKVIRAVALGPGRAALQPEPEVRP